jgi:hypothetical protein
MTSCHCCVRSDNVARRAEPCQSDVLSKQIRERGYFQLGFNYQVIFERVDGDYQVIFERVDGE